MKKTILLLLGSLCAVSFAGAASFDCKKAKTKQEQMICTDAELSALDDSLAVAYKSARTQTPSSLRPTLIRWQRQWLEDDVQACANRSCVKSAYQAQIKNLTHISPKSPSGVYVRYWKGKPDEKDTGTIAIIALTNNQAYIDGDAGWVSNVSTGNVNIGQIIGVFPLNQQRIRYTYIDDVTPSRCELTLAFKPNALTITGSSMACGWGHNVTFDGDYRKVK